MSTRAFPELRVAFLLAIASLYGPLGEASAAPQGPPVPEPGTWAKPAALPEPSSTEAKKKGNVDYSWKVEEGEKIVVNPDGDLDEVVGCWTTEPAQGHAVYGHSGEFTLSEVDLRIPGRGFDFVWARKYRSRLGPVTEIGNGWDYSYDLRVVAQGPDRVVWDGNTRRDLYLLQPGGTWRHPQFFRELELQPGTGVHTLVFSDGGKWVFRALTDPIAPGRVAAIIDRNGNTMKLFYDGASRLVTVRDTLHTAANPREVQIAYGPSGKIDTLTDWTGRIVRYAYYVAGDPGGSPGDLKSVTSPAVVPTPDYPQPPGATLYPAGKTTVYTYSTGTGDPALDHNLLSVTDPKGQTWLVNTYAPTANPADLEYDRVVRQSLGVMAEVIVRVYTPLAPSPANGFAEMAMIVNDRVGNVTEELFDAAANRVRVRRYTGRWSPGVPVLPPIAPPIPPLRPGDPAYFETRTSYKPSGMPAQVVTPNGTIQQLLYESDLNPSAPPRSAGKIRERALQPGVHLPVGDQLMIVEHFEYDTAGSNFVTRHVDGRGNETLHTYDAAGNRVRTVHRLPSIVEDFTYNAFGQLTSHVHPTGQNGARRTDAYTYYGPADGAQNGYLKSVAVDAPGLALTTSYAYNRVGALVRRTDPRGNSTDWMVNQLGQVSSELSRPVGSPSVRYVRNGDYDANDNLMRVDVQNVDEAGAVLPNAWLTRTYQYNALESLTHASWEVDASSSVVTEYEYDANENLVRARNGAAVSGAQPANEVVLEYDERNLILREIRAPGDPSQSTTQIDYDGNGSTVRTLQGLEDTPRERLYVYDAYDRVVQATDPMGNVESYHYDANSNRVAWRLDGELLDQPGTLANVRLEEASSIFDPMDRVTLERTEFFDPASGTPFDDGAREHQFSWADNGELVLVTDDHGHAERFFYDSGTRPSLHWDAMVNETAYVYDASSNVVQIVETERSGLGNPDQVFTTTRAYDALDRLVSETDSAGNVRAWKHDSRDQVTRYVDGRGNQELSAYDGLGRLIGVTRLMTATGQGGGAPAGALVTSDEWDESSRHVAHTDANGNRTLYSYDPLDRLAGIAHQDGSQETRLYDVHDNEIVRVDAVSSVVDHSYDLCDRVSQRSIARASTAGGAPIDVLGKTFEAYHYDGSSRIVVAQDDNTSVTRAYDSLGNLRQESLAIMDGYGASVGTLQRDCDAEGLRRIRVYPGNAMYFSSYDALERVSQVRNRTLPGQDDLVVAYDYIGPDRLERRTTGNGVVTSYEYDGITGKPNPVTDRGVKRLVRTKTVKGPVVLDEHAYFWDAAGNNTLHRDQRARPRVLQFIYAFDSADRMVRSTRSANPLASPPGMRVLSYALDNAGNRTAVTSTPGTVSPAIGTYVQDAALPEPADRQANQYTTTPYDQRLYDPKGNLTRNGGVWPSDPAEMRYDYADRMVLRTDMGPNVASEYLYDALGRRVSAAVLDPLVGVDVTRYFYDGDVVVEEQDEFGATKKKFVTGYIDFDRIIYCSSAAAGDLYYHGDDAGGPLFLTDASGSVAERYEYDDCGEPLIKSPSGTPLAASAVANDVLFRGMRWSAEAQMYWDGARYLEPRVGRFTSRGTTGATDSLYESASELRCWPKRGFWSEGECVTVYQRTHLSLDPPSSPCGHGRYAANGSLTADPWLPSWSDNKGEHKKDCTCETCKRVSYIMVHHKPPPHSMVKPGGSGPGCPKCGICHDPSKSCSGPHTEAAKQHSKNCTCETCKRVSYIMVHHQSPHSLQKPGSGAAVGCPKCGQCHDPKLTWLCSGSTDAKGEHKKDCTCETCKRVSYIMVHHQAPHK